MSGIRLSKQRAKVLGFVQGRDRVDAHDVARFADIGREHATAVLCAIHERGLICRGRAHHSGRSRMVYFAIDDADDVQPVGRANAKTTAADHVLIQKLYRNGMRVDEIGARYKISDSRVRKLCQGLTRPRKGTMRKCRQCRTCKERNQFDLSTTTCKQCWVPVDNHLATLRDWYKTWLEVYRVIGVNPSTGQSYRNHRRFPAPKHLASIKAACVRVREARENVRAE